MNKSSKTWYSIQNILNQQLELKEKEENKSNRMGL